MKCLKYQYMSSLCGNVQCEGVNPDADYYEFGPEAMLKLYNRESAVKYFMAGIVEDLMEYVDEELRKVVAKAVFGRTCVQDDKLYLLTEIYTIRRLEEHEQTLLEGWIEGQMSDGWGESLEQQIVISDTVNVNRPYFEEERAMFVDDEVTVEATYYLDPWNRENWDFKLLDIEQVEMDIEGESLNFELRQTVKETEIAQLKEEVKELTKKLREYTTKLTEIVEKVNVL